MVAHAQQNKLPAIADKHGALRFYDPVTNTFGAYNPDGTTRSFYKSPAGERYFQNQINKYVPDGSRGGGGGGLPPDHRLTILKPKLN